MTSCKNEPKTETIHLRIIHTSDVHGHVLDSLPRIAAYVAASREAVPDGVILTDGGDVLQGHPAAYYYNFIDTLSPHVVAAAMNRLDYDMAALGNHDVETGHTVYDRWIRQCEFPVLGANIINEQSGEPYLQPYTVIERQGLRIAFLGLITPAIPNWLPRNLWSGLRFEDMVVAAQKWVPIIQEREQPDLLVGLFHAGVEEEQGIRTDDYCENEARLVAQQVSGFDLILYGHDHRRHLERVATPDGDSIFCIGPTSTGACVCQVDIDVQIRKNKEVRESQERPMVVGYHIEAKHVDSNEMDSAGDLGVRETFDKEFEDERQSVADYLQQPVGVFSSPLYERDAFFGPSAFIDLIHDLQLELSQGAVISFAAPLSFDATIQAGMTHVSDMFSLYKYENLLYTMRLSGREVHDFLEMSYDLWCNTMQSSDDHIMLMDSVLDGGKRLGLKNMAFNFDSAAGVRYTVDASKPNGQKVTILSMEDGTPFDENQDYLVALNSYRGNGGGELLTRGAGIPLSELPARVVASTDHDLRYHLIEMIRKKKTVTIRVRNNWRFVPDDWAPAALARDRAILFPKGEKRWQH
ncbi:MAG: 5'-nucleotidase C-terminal domain-containing protein [Bacteroidaceae bacterium]|nr:5'-nucleotidase C-terminal domain-containing protein [Bacteroidaceae bacterium]